MNNYLETIDEAISQLHSRWHSHDYYLKQDYDRDLIGLIELRSFVEEAMEKCTLYPLTR
jgi:hypothetical protein